MHIQRLPRKLWYRWSTGAEIEYPSDIPTPVPEIKCDEVTVTVPPSLPGYFTLWGQAPNGNWGIICQPTLSYAQPQIVVVPFAGMFDVGMRVMNLAGVWFNASGNGVSINWYVTPGNTQLPRRDLLVGVDRIVNPTLNTPCPTWRFTGGNCPPGSVDCGNCCLDCASVKAGIDAATASILPFSTWRPK